MPAARNLNWTRDELILALDVYFRFGRRVLAKTHPEIVELSRVLNVLPIHPPESRGKEFRNPNGVVSKLANFRYLDPAIPGGLANGSALDQAVWDEFTSVPDIHYLFDAAEAIRRNASQPESATPAPEGEIEEAREGTILLRVHEARERNRAIVQRRKERALKQHGRLRCEVCGFDFREAYGDLGDGFIECHHTMPLSKLAPGQTTKLADLALVCANCHRMLHRGGEVVSITRLRELIGAARLAGRG